MRKYAIGMDFGSLSGRAVVVDLENGAELASAVYEYPHGVMSEALPCGTRLKMDYALEHPQDYLDALGHTIPEVLKKSGVSNQEVAGLGIDFTACTVLPVKKDGTPLCFLPEFQNRPHAYVKLWKHHAAQEDANRLNEIAAQRGEAFLQRYGGKISSEWLFPKLSQIVREDPALYQEMDRFIEAADWIVWQLTGKETRNSCTAGYKAIWHKQEGYPSEAFFEAYHPQMKHVIKEKLEMPVTPIGEKAGGLTQKAADLTGLLPGTAVAVGNVDAHVAIPAVGITKPGQMLMIMGTSTCHILLGEEEKMVPGMCGVVEDGVMPGYFGYEAGQSCVGDHFDWFVKHCVPASYQEQAGGNIHKFLREKAEMLRPGQSGLLALDWWNGNRSVLVDVDLTGMILGMTLATKPEEIYRALLEATAYGTRMIVETFRDSGVPIHELYAAGGIAQKDPLMMQIYSDVTNMEIKIADSAQAPAYGSALFGAVAGGYFDSIFTAAEKIGKVKDKVYRPIPKHVQVYDKLFQEYKTLHDYFGRGENHVMKRLKKWKENQ